MHSRPKHQHKKGRRELARMSNALLSQSAEQNSAMWAFAGPGGGGGWYSLIWPVSGRAVGKGAVFGLSVLKRA